MTLRGITTFHLPVPRRVAGLLPGYSCTLCMLVIKLIFILQGHFRSTGLLIFRNAHACKEPGSNKSGVDNRYFKALDITDCHNKLKLKVQEQFAFLGPLHRSVPVQYLEHVRELMTNVFVAPYCFILSHFASLCCACRVKVGNRMEQMESGSALLSHTLLTKVQFLI